MPVPLDPRLDDVHLFRQTESTPSGFGISTKPLCSSTIRSWMRRLGEITGFKQVARPYGLRYGAGKAFDDSSTFGESHGLQSNALIGKQNMLATSYET